MRTAGELMAHKGGTNNTGGKNVVTGATDGIGKAYATELAKNGMNIILVSRTQEKLENVAQEIRGRYAVETEIVRADFSVGRTIYDDISKHLEGKEIGILGKFIVKL
nr:inactive hydroxysteroid dehydrogenase-like protein 1 [Cherax quadricarinatus]